MASTVYTESVVTLNATQAEATMNALKSSAEDLRKKMIEATKLGNSEDAAKYQKQLDQVNKSMNSIKKETKDYSEIMKKLNGSTLNELAKAYSGLNKQIKNLVPGTKEFIEKSKQLKQVKSRMDEINGSVKGTNKTLNALKGMLPKLGIATVFAVAAKAVIQFGKDAISQTQAVGDKWQAFTMGAKTAYNSFVTDLTTGKGWNELLSNMREAYEVGKKVAYMLDELDERNWSLSRTEAKLNIEIEQNKQLMRDTSRSQEERLDAAQKVIDAERQIADERKSIAHQEADAYKMLLQQRLDMSDTDLEAYIEKYNQNRDIIQQAQQYSTDLENAEKAVRRLQIAYGMEPNDALGQLLEQAQQKLTDLQNNTDDTVKNWAEIDAEYQRSNNELVSNYINALNKMDKADAEYYSSTTRSNTMLASFKKELSNEHLQASENAYKAEIAGVDQHQKEMELKAKEAYANGVISEQQYQARLTSIQETAMKSKMDISERYKKETIEYQSQLLDLTIKQQEELKKILEESEKDAAKFFENMAAESESEIEEIMSQIDADFEEQMNHLLDLVDQADEVRAALDPATALGQQLNTELAGLEELYENKLLSEEEFQQAKQNLIKDFMKANLEIELEGWMQGIEVSQQFFNEAANAVSALQEAKMAQLDAQMQAELTAAGDNAEERERIEAEYEEKKLETQKKYAVADMVVNIAKAVAAGALASIQAWTAAGGNPITAGIFTALIAATTAAQIATMVAQKNAIMNTTVNSSGSAGAQQGARMPTGYSSGGYTTEASNDYQEVGVVHANEWVAPASMVRSNPIVFRRLEMARKKGTPVSGVGGFADGGMTSGSIPSQTLSGVDPVLLRDLTTVLQYIVANGLHAYVVTSEFNAKMELEQLLKKITGKK